MINFYESLTTYELVFLIIGFVGQGLFASRFVVQWLYSEKKGKSYIPIQFNTYSGGGNFNQCGHYNTSNYTFTAPD